MLDSSSCIGLLFTKPKALHQADLSSEMLVRIFANWLPREFNVLTKMNLY